MTSDETGHASTNGNGHIDVERDGKQGATLPNSNPNSWRTKVAVNIEDFSFAWFTVCMNTGIISILFHQSPYQFNGLPILSTILFVLDLVLFIFFFIVLLLRLIFFPRAISKSISTNLTELCLTSAVPIAWFTLVTLVGLIVSNSYWGGHAFTVVAFVMWWIGTAVTIVLALKVLIIVAKTEVANTHKLTPALVVPFVATATDAVTGGILCLYAKDVSPQLAVPTIIFGYMLNGIGLFVAIFVYSAYMVRLMNHGQPPGAQTPGLALLAGPPGQSAAAMMLLGGAAKKHFGEYNKGTFLTAAQGEVASAFGVLFALLLLGLGIIFTAFPIYMMLHAAWKREHKYTLTWWSTIFPFATINTSWVVLAGDLDSVTFKVLASIFLIALVINYLINWGFTLYHLFVTGRVLSSRTKAGEERPKAS